MTQPTNRLFEVFFSVNESIIFQQADTLIDRIALVRTILYRIVDHLSSVELLRSSRVTSPARTVLNLQRFDRRLSIQPYSVLVPDLLDRRWCFYEGIFLIVYFPLSFLRRIFSCRLRGSQTYRNMSRRSNVDTAERVIQNRRRIGISRSWAVSLLALGRASRYS